MVVRSTPSLQVGLFVLQEMVLAGMSHLGSAVEADGHSISGIHRTHYMDP